MLSVEKTDDKNEDDDDDDNIGHRVHHNIGNVAQQNRGLIRIFYLNTEKCGTNPVI